MTRSELLLRPFAETDVPTILALQHRLMPRQWRWTEAEAREELCDMARGGGSRVEIAASGSEIVGVAGWVELGVASGEFYGAPLLAVDEGVAAQLLARLVERARRAGAAWIRTSARPWEVAKRAALTSAGFAVAFEFVDLELALPHPSPAPEGPVAGLTAVPLESLDMAAYAELHNECFRHVDNAPAIDPEEARQIWQSPLIWREGSQVLADASGRYQAFLLMCDGGKVDSVGVTGALRGRGVATSMLRRAKHLAHEMGFRSLRSICSDRNRPSMDLHRALGFIEIGRRESWQLDLDGAQ